MHWQLELQEPGVSTETLAACMSWRQAHPLHERAWQRAEALAQRMSEMRSPNQRPLAHAALRPTLSRRTALKQLGLVLAAGAGAWSMKDTAVLQDLTADYHSQVGEQQRHVLADNTEVELNTDSAINVVFEREARRIKLLRGEMLITRDKMADGRPLSVTTAEGRIDVALARFSVRQRTGVTQVSVYQGSLVINLNTFSQGSYAITNLLVRYEISRNLTASVNLNNVFDRAYYSSPALSANYGAPRNVMTSFKYDF